MTGGRAMPWWCLLAVGCSGPAAEPSTQAPPLQLRPFLGDLMALAATLPPPAAAVQSELRDLADIALQLTETDPRTAARAERALLEHADAWWVLEPALLHEDARVRSRAAWLCGQTGAAELQAALVLRLKYEADPDAVLWVADALQRLGNDCALGVLDGAMGTAATAERAGQMAIEICRERSLPLAAAPTYVELQQHLRQLFAGWHRTGTSSRPGAPAPAGQKLDARFAAHLQTTQGTKLRPVDDARFVTTRCGRLPVPLLVRTLAAEEPYLRTMALQVLTDIGAPARDAAPAVLALLADPLTGAYAVRALGAIGATEAVPYLRRLVTATDIDQRSEAVQALGLLQDHDSAAALRGRLADDQETMDVRVGAAFGLLCLGPDAAAEAFLTERQQRHDYHEPTLARLRERLARLGR
ncbi:MAG: HEAT repeat domain-containing protein [Planctomycetes bacterium]|nr:HEAT repeat domain-containing protein [Planctomycetota bacterium]